MCYLITSSKPILIACTVAVRVLTVLLHFCKIVHSTLPLGKESKSSYEAQTFLGNITSLVTGTTNLFPKIAGAVG